MIDETAAARGGLRLEVVVASGAVWSILHAIGGRRTSQILAEHLTARKDTRYNERVY